MNRPPQRVSVAWKLAQLVCYLVAFVTAVLASVTFGKSVQQFDGQCFLYTEVNLSLRASGNSTHIISTHPNGGAKVWQLRGTCDFSTFVPVGSSAFAFIAAYFILMCDRAAEIVKRRRMDSLFFPLLIFTFIFAVLMVIASAQTLNGTEVFCASVWNSIFTSCAEVQYMTWDEYKLIDGFYDLLLTSLIASWICATAFFASVAILILRCFCGIDLATENLSLYGITKMVAPRKPLRQQSGGKPFIHSRNLSSSTLQTSLEPAPGSSSEPQFTGQVVAGTSTGHSGSA